MTPNNKELMDYIEQVYTNNLENIRKEHYKYKIYSEEDRIREVFAIEVLRLIEIVRRHEES